MSTKTRVLQAPRVQRGDRITARAWNQIADAINSISAPTDLDSGEDLQVGGYWIAVTNVDKVSRRVTNPEDETQYVDVDDVRSFSISTSSGLIDAINAGLPVAIGNFTDF